MVRTTYRFIYLVGVVTVLVRLLISPEIRIQEDRWELAVLVALHVREAVVMVSLFVIHDNLVDRSVFLLVSIHFASLIMRPCPTKRAASLSGQRAVPCASKYRLLPPRRCKAASHHQCPEQ
jgi:hypothetical protein